MDSEPSCIWECRAVPVGNAFSSAGTANDTKLYQLFRQLMANSQLCYCQQATYRRTSPALLPPYCNMYSLVPQSLFHRFCTLMRYPHTSVCIIPQKVFVFGIDVFNNVTLLMQTVPLGLSD